MKKDRQLVVMAVLEGKLPIDMITKKELDEQKKIQDAIAAALIAEQNRAAAKAAVLTKLNLTAEELSALL